MKTDLEYMNLAIKLAQRAADQNEVPVGALIVAPDGSILSKSFNKREAIKSALAHAELQAIHQACLKTGSWRLEDCTLFVTLEPCVMCSGGILQARIKRVVYGAPDPKGGATHSLYNLLNDKRLNHQVEVLGGVLQEECSNLLKEFFRKLRKSKKD